MGAPSSPKSSPKSLLADPQAAAFAWARYRRLIRWLMLATLTMVTGAFVVLYRQNGLISIHFYIATALGLSFAMLLMSAVMGLVFLSKGKAHDGALTDGAKADAEVTRPPDEA